MKQYSLTVFQSFSGKYYINCPDLVGKLPHGGWHIPANILGLSVVEFIEKLSTYYNARIRPYYVDGKLEWLDYYWDNLGAAERFKSDINSQAKKKRIVIDFL